MSSTLRFHNFIAGFEGHSGDELFVDATTGRVVAGGGTAPATDVDCRGAVLLPGFVDLQFNGAFNVDFSTQTVAADDIDTVLAGLLQFGVTSVCPTVISSSRATYTHTLAIFRQLWRASGVHGWAGAAVSGTEPAPGGGLLLGTPDAAAAAQPTRGDGVARARVLGMHLEGPFLNLGRKGAHAPGHLCSPAPEGTERLGASGDASSEAVPAVGTTATCTDGSSTVSRVAGEADNALSCMPRVYGPATQYLMGPHGSGSSGASGGAVGGSTIARSEGTATISAQAGAASGACDAGFVRIVTLAPELPGALPLIRALSASSRPPAGEGASAATPDAGVDAPFTGVVCSIGHTTAGYDCCDAAVSAGARLVTHMFNAMAPLSHRGDPGPIALLGRPESAGAHASGALSGPPYFSIITDGAHVHPAAAALAFRAAPHRCVLVTDAMPALGAGLGPTRYGDLPVMIHGGVEVGDGTYPGVHAVVAGTSTLAGAVAPLDRCLRNLAAAVGIDARALAAPASGGSGADRSATAYAREGALKALRAVVATVTSNPACCLGLQHVIGSLEPGCFGDVVLLDPASLAVVQVFLGGRLAWNRAAAC